MIFIMMFARAYHLNLDFENAMEHYKAYYSSFSIKELEKYDINVDKYIRQCKYGQELVNSPVRVIINNLGERINSEYDDYNPVLHPNQDRLYFTSRRKLIRKIRFTKLIINILKMFLFLSKQEIYGKRPKLLENKLDSKTMNL